MFKNLAFDPKTRPNDRTTAARLPSRGAWGLTQQRNLAILWVRPLGQTPRTLTMVFAVSGLADVLGIGALLWAGVRLPAAMGIGMSIGATAMLLTSTVAAAEAMKKAPLLLDGPGPEITTLMQPGSSTSKSRWNDPKAYNTAVHFMRAA